MSAARNANTPLMRVQDEMIVINSDSECDEEGETNALDQSVIIMDTQVEKRKAFPAQAQKVVDEDLVITFSQRADVLPHARYDCPVYPFQPTDEKKVAINSNFLLCEQCYCYICDKPASQCESWTVRDACHCNGHRSDYWRGLRDARLLGFLRAFNITLLEVDNHLRDAEVMLGSFNAELTQKYFVFLRGWLSAAPQQGYAMYIYDYTPVYECVCTFLDKADSQEDKAAAVMRLGAAKSFMAHNQPSGMSSSPCPKASVTTAKALLIERVLVSVQRQMVLADFGPEFSKKLQVFYQLQLGLPPALKWRWLSLRPWNDMLLVSVLKGQNVCGFYKAKGGKKDTLVEEWPVILLRVQHLQNQHRYRELCRYLRVVQCQGSQDEQTRFQEVADLLPLYMCLTGDFSEAMNQFIGSSQKCPTHRLSPFFFKLYLHILETGTAPVLTAELPTQATLTGTKWERIEGAVPRLHTRLVALSLRVMKVQKDIYSHAGCWEALLSMVNTPRNALTPLEKPSNEYLENARIVARAELNKSTQMDNICFPVSLVQRYPHQGLLLLMTEALAMRIANGPLEPAVPVVNTYKDNEWAFQCLCDSLMLYSSDIYLSFMKGLLQELQSAPAPAENADDGTAQAPAANVSPSSHWLLPHPLSYYYPSLSVQFNMTHW